MKISGKWYGVKLHLQLSVERTGVTQSTTELICADKLYTNVFKWTVTCGEFRLCNRDKPQFKFTARLQVENWTKTWLVFYNTVVSLFSIAFIVNRCFLRTARLSSTTVHHISTSSEKGERSWEEVTLKVWLPVTHKHICVSWVILCQVYVQQHEYVTHDMKKCLFFKLPPVWRSTVRWSWTWVLFFI